MGGRVLEVFIKRQFEDGYQWVVSSRAGTNTTYDTSEGSIKSMIYYISAMLECSSCKKTNHFGGLTIKYSYSRLENSFR